MVKAKVVGAVCVGKGRRAEFVVELNGVLLQVIRTQRMIVTSDTDATGRYLVQF